MELKTIPVPCWACGKTFDAPAHLSLLPPQYVDPRWYGQQASAKVWAYVDRVTIAEHVQSHWPMLVFLFYWWKSVVEVMGLDPLDHWRDR
jgi:hypothetical protein